MIQLKWIVSVTHWPISSSAGGHEWHQGHMNRGSSYKSLVPGQWWKGAPWWSTHSLFWNGVFDWGCWGPAGQVEEHGLCCVDFSLFLLGFQHQHLAVLGHKFQLGALCLFQPIFFVLIFCPLSVTFVAKLLGNVTCGQGLETKQKKVTLCEKSFWCFYLLWNSDAQILCTNLREMSPISAWMFHKCTEYSNAPSSHSERNHILKKAQFYDKLSD